MTANTSSIDDGDGLDSVSYSYQWIRSDNGADTDIAGETDSTYTLVLADLGKTIKVRVTFTDDADNAETLTSVATVAVAAAPNRDATGQLTISGTPQVDETLTADTSAHIGRGRPVQRLLPVPVAAGRCRHNGPDQLHLPAGLRRRGQDHQGPGHL